LFILVLARGQLCSAARGYGASRELIPAEQVAAASKGVNRKNGRFPLTLAQAGGDNRATLREETEQ
jgi:hypothetical protein